MADFRLNISDGVTQVNLYGGTGALCREAGISMPVPEVKSEYISSAYSDGDRLAYDQYGNRVITITTKINGNSLAEVRDNVRSIERVLNDAKYRTLLGQGTAYYLEMQWGDTAGSSTYFDILRGDLKMPDGYINHYLRNDFIIPSAQIELTCKPFGRMGTIGLAPGTAQNSQSAFRVMDSYTTADTANEGFVGTGQWVGQTFTPSASYTTSFGGFMFVRTFKEEGGTALIMIKNTTAGTPTGNPLTIGTANLDGCGTASAEWALASYPPILVGAGTVYALIAYRNVAVGVNVFARSGTTLPVYASGSSVISANGGTTWTQDNTKDILFAVYGTDSGQQNWRGITIPASYGDVPVPIYAKFDQSLAFGTTNIWLAKRSGLRQGDDLWLDGCEVNSLNKISTINSEIGGFYTLTSGHSSDSSYRINFHWNPSDGTSAMGAGTILASVNIPMTSVPKGYYKVLAKTKSSYLTRYGLGWTYGEHSGTPSSYNEFAEGTTANQWGIIDLGDLRIPPVSNSEIAPNNTMSLTVYAASGADMIQHTNNKIDINHLFLCPIDEGVITIGAVTPTDTIVIDGISDSEGVYLLNAGGTVTEVPDFIGKPFKLGREDTRLYMLRNDGTAMNFVSNVTIRPNFLII